MDYRQADRIIRAFKDARQQWVDALVANPESTTAAENIVTINAKIELLRMVRTPYPDDYEGDFE